jgi:hypothetical protein
MRVAILVLAFLVVSLGGYLAFDRWWPSGYGSVWVVSDPPGAQIWLDLKPTAAVTNGLVTRVPTGQHSVTVRLDTLQSEPVARVVDVKRDSRDTLSFTLSAPVFGKAPVLLPAEASARPEVPTGDELRRIGERADSATRSFVNPVEPPKLGLETEAEGITGKVEISSSILGSQVFVNGELRSEMTPTRLELPIGTYTIRVAHQGYTVDPDEQSVRVTKGTVPQFVFFTLKQSDQSIRQFTVRTSPVSGKIFVDTVLVGEGTATAARDFGVYMVTFGEVEGYKTPQPIRVSLTPSKPQQEIQGVYTRIFHILAGIDSSGSVVSEGNIRWSTGVFFEEGGAEVSPSQGPRPRPIPESRLKGWELAQGDPTRNPTGDDYIEFAFDLPADVLPTSPLGLRLYLYRSNERYALTISSRSEVIVTVNGKVFLDGYRPVYGTDAADEGRYEEWSLQGMLKPGENHVMIRNGEGNTLINFLWKVEIL